MRVFTVGLRSGAFDAAPLRSIAEQTGGAYAEARSAAELAAIYDELGSAARGRVPRPLPVRRAPDVAGRRPDRRSPGAGEATTAYVAPTPSLLAPYHRSPISTFLLSGGSPLVLALFFGLLVCGLCCC